MHRTISIRATVRTGTLPGDLIAKIDSGNQQAQLRSNAAAVAIAAPAQAQDKSLTLCWAAWDPANALVELGKDFTDDAYRALDALISRLGQADIAPK